MRPDMLGRHQCASERDRLRILAMTYAPARKAFNKELAIAGLSRPVMPTEYGGQGRPGIYEYLPNE